MWSFAYSDVAYATLMHLASRAVGCGRRFLAAERRAHAVAVEGAGHFDLRRAYRLRQEPGIAAHCGGIAQAGMESGGDSSSHALRRSGRAARAALCERWPISICYKCTIEEREEYEPHIIEGTTVYAGVDYDDILRQAEKEGDVILWDGGNNDTSFYQPDLDDRGARSASCRDTNWPTIPAK